MQEIYGNKKLRFYLRKTYRISITNIIIYTMFRTTTAVSSENRTKYMNTLCAKLQNIYVKVMVNILTILLQTVNIRWENSVISE